MRPSVSRRAGAVAVSVALTLLVGCGDARGGAWWSREPTRRPASTTISLSLGERATLHGPNGARLAVSVDLTSRPPVPITLSPEQATFLQVHLTVRNTGPVPYAGVLADAADLAVVPGGTVAPLPRDRVPSEIALTAGVDLTGEVQLPPEGPPIPGTIVFQIDPEDQPSAFSLTLPGGNVTARWSV